MTAPLDFTDLARRLDGTFTPATEPFDPRLDVPRERWREAASQLAAAGLELSDLTALDHAASASAPTEPDDAVEPAGLELVAWLIASPTRQLRLGTALPEADLAVDSLVSVFPSAAWAEREVFDLFGVRFAGHPDLTRILLPDDATIHPLRKSFALEVRTW